MSKSERRYKGKTRQEWREEEGEKWLSPTHDFQTWLNEEMEEADAALQVERAEENVFYTFEGCNHVRALPRGNRNVPLWGVGEEGYCRKCSTPRIVTLVINIS